MLSYIEIDAKVLKNNLHSIRSFLHAKKNSSTSTPPKNKLFDKKIISVVKANAYGVGLPEVVQILDHNTDAFGVNNADEALIVRKITNKPIYLLGYVGKKDIEKCIHIGSIFSVYGREYAIMINTVAKGLNIKAKINIKIDAFLGRQGILLEEVDDFVKFCLTLKNVDIIGIYAHFSNLEDSNNLKHAKLQSENYEKALNIAQTLVDENNNGTSERKLESHISSTAGALLFDRGETFHSHVRIGIGLYGLWPSQEIYKEVSSKVDLKPIVRWITHIAQVKTVPKNFPIGYGLTYITQRETRLAVIPQGYSDGYDRGLSNKGEVLIHGKRCPVLGRIAMNMFVVDVSDISGVSEGDEVVLLGKQKYGNQLDEITAEEIAEKIETINYEVISRIRSSLPRVVV